MSDFNLVEVDNDGFKSLNTAGTAVDLATEAKLEAVRVLLASLDAKDFSTETTLNNFLTAFNAEDFASQTTLAALLAAFNAEDFSSETTLAALLAAFNAEDFASETTLVAVDAVLDTIYTRQNDRSQKTQITDGTNDGALIHDVVDGIYRLAIDGKVAVVNLSPPVGTDPKQVVADTPLNVTSGISPHDTEYTITSGKTFTLQSITAGSEGDSTENGSRIDVIYQDGGGEHLVAREYVSGFSNTINPDTDTTRDGTVMVGTGTEKIIVRRVRLSGGTLEIDAVAKGFES